MTNARSSDGKPASARLARSAANPWSEVAPYGGIQMERIYIAEDPIFVGYLKSLLQDAGIRCVVRNELLIGASGELPPNECWPEIWVLDTADADAARRLIDQALTPPNAPESWCCPHCAEALEGQFNACWRCGSLRR